MGVNMSRNQENGKTVEFRMSSSEELLEAEFQNIEYILSTLQKPLLKISDLIEKNPNHYSFGWQPENKS